MYDESLKINNSSKIKSIFFVASMLL